MKHYIIDGHNLILTNRHLSEVLDYRGPKAPRELLEARLIEWGAGEERVRIVLYYDGRDFEGSHPGNRDEGVLSVRFTDPPAEADDRIVYEASRLLGMGEVVIVVTGDRGIAQRLGGSGVRSADPSAFWRRIRPRPAALKKEEHFSAEEIATLGAEMLARSADSVEDPIPAPDSPGEVHGRSSGPTRLATPPVIKEKRSADATRRRSADREARREAFREKQKRRDERREAKKKPSKKRRGW